MQRGPPPHTPFENAEQRMKVKLHVRRSRVTRRWAQLIPRTITSLHVRLAYANLTFTQGYGGPSNDAQRHRAYTYTRSPISDNHAMSV